MRVIAVTLVVSIVAVSLATPGLAQDANRGDHLAALRSCQGEADPARKLACYETAARALLSAAEDGEVRLVDRQEREKTRRGLFGFNIGRIFGGDGNEDSASELAEMSTLVSTVTEVRQLDRKTYLIRIAEANALWQINEAPSRFIMPKVGEKIEFKRAAMGSYFVRVGNQIGVKGRRVG